MFKKGIWFVNAMKDKIGELAPKSALFPGVAKQSNPNCVS